MTFPWESVIYGLAAELLKNRDKIKKIFSTDFLNYDPQFLCEAYDDENSISGGIPYKEEVCWLGSTWEDTMLTINNIELRIIPQQFKLDASSKTLRLFQSDALNKFKKSGRMNRDSNVIRLNSLDFSHGKTLMHIQAAKYSDQVQSNLVFDWSNGHALKEEGISTLRYFFRAHYGKKLPPLSENQLANTIGIAAILFYKNAEGQYVPYLPKRAKGILDSKEKLAVFTGGEYHCTASGAAEWNDKGANFSDFFTDDMFRELQEEVGLSRNDISIMLPISLCREFLRGGKPQIFFAGLISCPFSELAEKRKNALIEQKKLLGKIEIKDDQLLISDINKLVDQIKNNSMTLEAIANSYYAAKFLRQHLSAADH